MVSSSGVNANNSCFICSGSAPARNEILISIPSFPEWFSTCEMFGIFGGIFFPFLSTVSMEAVVISAMRFSTMPDFVKGTSTTCKACSLLEYVILPRIRSRPLPVSYMLSNSLLLMTTPPVGKSGPCKVSSSSAVVLFGFFKYWIIVSHNSPGLCGGMEQANPTAIPLAPFSNNTGICAGMTTGICSESS